MITQTNWHSHTFRKNWERKTHRDRDGQSSKCMKTKRKQAFGICGINFNVNVGCIKGIKRELNQIEISAQKGPKHKHDVGATGF